MKQLSERQQKTFEEIKEKKRLGRSLTDWEKKFLMENGIELKILEQPAGTASASFNNCPTCQGTGKFSFRRVADDFQTIDGFIMNIKGSTWSFACPECSSDSKNHRPIEQKLLDNPRWEFRNTEADRKRLEKFFFFNKEESLNQ